MVRVYAELVDVRGSARPEAAAGHLPQAPAAFVWRSRLYVVREVVGHWRERRSWWSGTAARAVYGDGDPAPEAVPELAAGPDLGPDLGADLGAEHEVWRVEASRGHSYHLGVFDLCRELSTQGRPGVWRLLRVAD